MLDSKFFDLSGWNDDLKVQFRPAYYIPTYLRHRAINRMKDGNFFVAHGKAIYGIPFHKKMFDIIWFRL